MSLAKALLLVFLSLVSCKTRTVTSGSLSSESAGVPTEAEEKASFGLYSFDMNELDLIVAAYQRNSRACTDMDPRETFQFLVSSLKSHQIPFGIMRLRKKSAPSGLHLVDENVKSILQEDFEKYGIIFFRPESIAAYYHGYYFPNDKFLIYSEKTGWILSGLLKGGENQVNYKGAETGEVYALMDHILASYPEETRAAWHLIHYPSEWLVGSSESENALKSEIISAKAAGKKFLIVPISTKAHETLAIVNFETEKIEFYDSWGGNMESKAPRIGEILAIVKQASKIPTVESYITENHQYYEPNPETGLANDLCGQYACKFARDRMAGVSPERLAKLGPGEPQIYTFAENLRLQISSKAQDYVSVYKGVSIDEASLEKMTLNSFLVEKGFKPIADMTEDEFIKAYEATMKHNRASAWKVKLGSLAYALPNILNDYSLESIEENGVRYPYEFPERYGTDVEAFQDLKVDDDLYRLGEKAKHVLDLLQMGEEAEASEQATAFHRMRDEFGSKLKTYIAEHADLSDDAIDTRYVPTEERQQRASEISHLREKFAQMKTTPKAPDIHASKSKILKGVKLVDVPSKELSFKPETCKSMTRQYLDSELTDYANRRNLADMLRKAVSRK